MQCCSTSDPKKPVPLDEALFSPFPKTGGLYLPALTPSVSVSLMREMHSFSLHEICFHLASKFFSNMFASEELETMIKTAFNFPLPMHPLVGLGMIGLELFHGPTLSFKDWGARFLRQLLESRRPEGKKITLFVATSGDTGSAIGHAFRGMQECQVVILFPKGRVTPTQYHQLTTIGQNVLAVELDGSFDLAQEFVRRAVMDDGLQKTGIVTTGNSINIGRLIAQSFYYFYAVSRLEKGAKPLISVPCGNWGHLASGLLAEKMGLPVKRFVGATNENDEIPLFLQGGKYVPHESIQTMSSSMDVGHPSNFERLLALAKGREGLTRRVLGVRVEEEVLGEWIASLEKTSLLDPHSAIGAYALHQVRRQLGEKEPSLFMMTAHLGKFSEAIEQVTGQTPLIPDALKTRRAEHVVRIGPSYEALLDLIL